MLLFLISVLLTSCAQDNRSLLIGEWEADQATQVLEGNEVIEKYNYFEMTKSIIN